MSRHALQEAAPIDDRAVDALELDALEDRLLAAIVAGSPAPVRRARPRRRMLAIGAVAAAAGFAGVGLSLTGSGGTSPEQAWGAPALRVANAVPRLLIGADGWKVERADEFTVGDGEMTFGDGTHSVDLHWSRAERYREAKLSDRASGAVKLPDVEVLGDRATVFAYPDGTDVTALWDRGHYRLEFRTANNALPRDQFVELLRTLRPASVDAWLSAMPASVVKPVDTEAVVAEMLRDMTLPPGFDRQALTADPSIRDRYQLGARVVSAVACDWVGRWIDAKRSGDEAAATRSVQALAGSRKWAILNEMKRDGAYPDVLWQYADAVAGDGTVMGGKPLTVEESYKDALGC